MYMSTPSAQVGVLIMEPTGKLWKWLWRQSSIFTQWQCTAIHWSSRVSWNKTTILFQEFKP